MRKKLDREGRTGAREVLRAAGFVALIVALFFAASMLVSVLLGLRLATHLTAVNGMDPDLLVRVAEDFVAGRLVEISAVSEVVALVLFWLTFRLLGGNLLRQCRFRVRPARDLWVAAGLGMGISVMSSAILNLSDVQRFFPEYAEVMRILVERPSLPVALLAVGLFGPLFEEIMYRGIIFNRMRGVFSLPVALLLQAAIFGALHGNVLQGAFAFLGSIPLALTYVWTGSLWIPVSIHAGWNTTSVLAARFLSPAPSAVGQLFAGTLGAAVFALGVSYFRRHGSDEGVPAENRSG